jgi:hypothetical protein
VGASGRGGVATVRACGARPGFELLLAPGIPPELSLRHRDVADKVVLLPDGRTGTTRAAMPRTPKLNYLQRRWDPSMDCRGEADLGLRAAVLVYVGLLCVGQIQREWNC